MSSLKPLIFIHPIQETLKELYKVMMENAESDGIEVYEIDSIAEFSQLFSSVGQSVCLFGNPKKCAQALQSVKNANKKLHSKMLLLSAKNIPKKTMEKFEKIGLTEAIIEPVAPKTLMYKVRLQLKSISTMNEQEEMNRKFGNESKEEEEAEHKKEIKDHNEKQRSSEFDEQNTTAHDEQEDINNTKKKQQYEEDDDLYGKKKIKRKSDEVIDSHMRGKVSKQEHHEDDEESTSSTDHIDSYMKGKTSQEIEPNDDDDPNSDSKEYDIEDLVDEVKQSLDLDVDLDITSQGSDKIKKFEEELERKKKEQKKLALAEERERNKKKNSQEVIDGHLKGDIKSKEQDQDGNLSSDVKRENIEDNEVTLSNSIDLEVSAENNKNKKQTTDDDDEEDDFDNDPALKLDLVDEDKASQSGRRDEIAGPMKGKSSIDPIDENENDTNEAQIDHIETMIKGSLSHQKQEEVEKEEKKKNIVLNTDDVKTDQHQNQELDDQEDDYSPSSQLHLVNESELNSERSEAEDIDESQSESCVLDIEKDGKSKKPKADEEETITNKFSKKNTNNEKQDNEDLYKRSTGDKDKKGLQGESSTDTTKKEHNKADARADKIETHYKGTGNSHKAQDWGSSYKRQKQEEDPELDPMKKGHESAFKTDKNINPESYGSEQRKKENPSFEFEQSAKKKNADTDFDYSKKNQHDSWDSDATKADDGYQYSSDTDKNAAGYEGDLSSQDLGEQTIDYDQLHKEFFHLDDMAVEIVVSEDFLYPDDDEQESNDDEVLMLDNDDIIHARPQGFDNLLYMIDNYQKNNFNCLKILNYIATEINQKTEGYFVLIETEHSEMLPVPMEPQAIQLWESAQAAYLPFWKKMTKATLMDPDYLDEENYYVYPLSHHSKFGLLAIVMFDKKACQSLNRSKILTIQIILQGLIPLAADLILLGHKEPKDNDAQVKKEFLSRFTGKKVG
jgi:hypothetical protein